MSSAREKRQKWHKLRDEDMYHAGCSDEDTACDFFDETRINPWSGLELNDLYPTYRTVATRCKKRLVRPAGFSPRGPWKPKVVYPSDGDRFKKPRRGLAAQHYHGPLRRRRTEVAIGGAEGLPQQQQYSGHGVAKDKRRSRNRKSSGKKHGRH